MFHEGLFLFLLSWPNCPDFLRSDAHIPYVCALRYSKIRPFWLKLAKYKQILSWLNCPDFLRSDAHILCVCCVSVLENQAILAQASEMKTDPNLKYLIFLFNSRANSSAGNSLLSTFGGTRPEDRTNTYFTAY